ncbi:two-component response regulator 24-like [Alnus glutinosa]|uniref:two-component response regulator 24-like n=1 Tax=Alnus glutinosa TaxID=3517 RepID=UPI002D7A002B|nr:two-component response regulator 24-like [Alnus glutinosa]
MMKSTKIGMKDELVINSVKAEPSSVLLGPSSKITALVVDDDTLNQMIHRRLLDGLGVQNQVVGNGKEAVDVHSSGKSFDLILMDKDMPVMNGIEATRKLRTMGIRSLIAGVSACSEEQEKQEFIEAGLDDYQEKPLSATKLASILHKLKKDG